ncbi:MAG TPA: hypothetical protein EYO04_03525 [Candidatus Marinimicrobia bacterium]|nr:hypothetical protein [Candidatus Neomarinimicrobiota bacterium]
MKPDREVAEFQTDSSRYPSTLISIFSNRGTTMFNESIILDLLCPCTGIDIIMSIKVRLRITKRMVFLGIND